MATKSRSSKKLRSDGNLPAEELTSPSFQEVTVPYLPTAKKFTQVQTIHPRRIIPTVPDGPDSPDPDPSPALALDLPQVMGMVADSRGAMSGPAILANTDNITVVKNVALSALAQRQTTSHVGEPSLATNGNVIFYTGNWYAAVSLDGGTTFQYIDPYHSFPDPPGMGFCCDQVVQYIKKIDTFVWLLQYSAGANGENIQRLAFATTADVKLGHWRTFDITPQSLGLPGVFLDFPDLAVGSNMLYATTNAFTGQNWTASVLVRMPLSGIKNNAITAQHTVSTTNFSFRVAQNCGTRAYWASHQNTSTLRVFHWDESGAQPAFNDVPVARWSGTNYNSVTPDGFNWLGRSDPRLVGATKAGTDLWFAWGASNGGANNRPHPYVQIARIRASTLALVDNVNLWDVTSATAYAALATNSNNEVGASYMIGGGGKFPTHAVAILTGTRKDVMVVQGAHGPSDAKWGDYLTVRRNYPKTKLFAASGYTLQTSSNGNNSTPHFILFGRSSDV